MVNIKEGRKYVLSSKAKNRMKRDLSVQKPTIWVGKDGASLHMMNEISKQLKTRRIVKIKILNSALKNENAKDVAIKIAQQTESTLIDVRGHTFILHKPRKKAGTKCSE
jgi:RNA-binding protein